MIDTSAWEACKPNFGCDKQSANGFDRRFHITYWYGPPSEVTSYAVYRQVSDAGFDIAGPMSTGGDEGSNLKFRDACAQNGIKAIVLDRRINQVIHGAEGWERAAEEIVRAYGSHPALFAYYVTDEPDTSAFPALARVVEIFRKLDPEHPAYINLFPNYASSEQLGAPDYYTYVKKYIEVCRPDFVSYDHYHFLEVPREDAAPKEEGSGDRREDLIRQSAMMRVDRRGFFENIEVVRDLCAEHDIPFMVIVLLIQHGPYRNLTEAELRFEAFQSLCYGAGYLSYFTYWTVNEPGSWWNWKNAMVDVNGLVLQHYYDVQRVNSVLVPYGNALKRKRSLFVSHFGPEPESVRIFTPHRPGSVIEGIKPDDPGDSDALPLKLTVGEFEDNYVLLCNKDFTAPCGFTAVFAGNAAYLRHSDGMPVSTNEREVRIRLAPGDALLIKVL
ncbi:MAG: hypothetical protein J5950_06780 [Clostridia bacterium]|nr:hypothetical protein [Clostridia bacterium]